MRQTKPNPAGPAPTHPTRRRPLPAVMLLLLPALACLLPGCASNPESRNARADEPSSVSALQYGYVRPAADVEVIGRGARRSYAGRNSDDLWDRVRRGRSMGIAHHPRVEQMARRMASNPNYLNDLNRRARPYLHMIVDELERAGLPAELALLPEIESRYNPRAVSPKAASGMWQFMPYTGREMGLAQNGAYDGRNDVLAATRGAIRYLKQLHGEMGGDWALALASYNCGPGCVRKAMRAHGSRDFWKLSRLPAETENYVPKLLAVLALVEQPTRYGLNMPKLPNAPELEVVYASRSISLAEVSRHSGASMQQLRDLNPGLKLGQTPVTGPHRVLVPVGNGDKLRRALTKAGKLGGPSLADARRARSGGS
ncbi:transglycosylase SLT domain-containing protein [Thiohalocapsa sp. ML1]|jgi:membrane-bound lytic murein transglycosylase D|uniref:transglycosylase SLT domain-containing protein n=1 Tax=Thiohalocapsa sp. ML1 TaxID=1431688 RepID=UPI0009EC2372|nr:transglycosylase SLT domain-containing protein [Thiohalocapsa sp. ML1]